MIAISVAFSAMWLYLTAKQDELARSPMPMQGHTRLRFTGGLFGYGLGVVVALWSAPAGPVIYALLAVYYVFNNLPMPSPEGDATGAGR